MTLSSLSDWLAATGTVLTNDVKRRDEGWRLRARSIHFDGELTVTADDYETALGLLMVMVDRRIERASNQLNH